MTLNVKGPEGFYPRHEMMVGLRPGEPWRELRDALRLGTARLDGVPVFVAPYWAVANLGELVMVITGANVNVRQNPTTASQVVARMSYDIVEPMPAEFDDEAFRREDYPSGPKDWRQIVTPSGAEGYVYGKFITTTANTRFSFVRVDGEWKLASIIEGD
jgi:hypothetical protein